MKRYRTIEQFETILDCAYNGNWTESAQCTIEYGFYATDFMQMIRDHKEQFGHIDQYYENYISDLILIIEKATELRNNGVN